MIKIIENRINKNTIEYWNDYYTSYDFIDVQQSRLSFYNDIKQFICLDKFKLLEIGCGSGYGLNYLFSIFRNNYFEGIDLSSIAIEKAKSLYPYLLFNQLDILKKNLYDTYDYIVMIETLEHLEIPTEIINKCLLKCKFLIISVPYKKEMRKEKHHVVVDFDEDFFNKFNLLNYNIVQHKYPNKTRTFLQVMLGGKIL